MDDYKNENYEESNTEQDREKYEETIKPGGERPYKRSGFGRGLVAGIAVSLICGLLFLVLYQNLSGKRAYFLPSDSSENESVMTSETISKIDTLTDYIRMYYYEDVTDETLEDGLYKGIMESMGDNYTDYYTVEEYENLQISATQNYYGIGAGLLQDEDTMAVSIIRVYEGTPAEAAGLKKGDIIVSVDEVQADTIDVSELVTYIRGEEGTKVHLEIIRDDEQMSFDVVRANVDLPTVTSKMLEEGIGYLRITEFGAGTAAQFEEAVAELSKEGMESMIVDLRDNPGGMVSSVTTILDDILPEGVLVYTEDKYGQRDDFTSSGDSKMSYPMAVLINGNSASASEIFAGAIRDYDYGTLIGTTTFGKGIVQTIFPLEDGDAIKLTTSKYFTPSGENIHGTGIEPDITLEYEYTGDPEAEEYNELEDNQVLKALEVLKEK
ncbi:MAG: S41 family peptidase [Lachnospiraceae bacterium]